MFEIRSERFDLFSAVSQHNWIVGLGLGGEVLTALIDGTQLSSQRTANAIQRTVKLGGGVEGIALSVELCVEGIETSASEMMPLLGCLAEAVAAARVLRESGPKGAKAAEGPLDDVLPLVPVTPDLVLEVALP